MISNTELLEEDILVNPAYQPMSITSTNYSELGDMPKQFGGENVTEKVNNLKNQQRLDALSNIN